MQSLIVPERLKAGDKVATVSLSWGGAGDTDLRWRYETGKRRLEEVFGLEVVEMPTTLAGSEYVYQNPEERAKDFMEAFKDRSIRAIFSCIGGDDSIRMLPYIDFDVIHKNPKIFLGYSDSTIAHFICRKAGIRSYYGPSILAEFAENVEIFPYTLNSIVETLFEPKLLGVVDASSEWTGEIIPWEEDKKQQKKQMKPNLGYELLQGEGIVTGPLIGGCMDVLEMMKGTCIWPELSEFEGAVLFFETSEDIPSPEFICYWLRNYGAAGILHKINGILWGKPYQEIYHEEYKEVIHKVIYEELGLTKLPILYNATFGHNEPMMVLPYGAMARIDCSEKTFELLEPGTK